MKTSLLLIITGMLASCSKPKHTFNDDYVLIEFAAKLETHYHAPKENQIQNSHHEDMHKPYDPPVTNEILLEDLDRN